MHSEKYLCAADAGEILPEVLLQHVVSDIRSQIAYKDRMVGGCVSKTRKSVDRGSWTTAVQLTRTRPVGGGNGEVGKGGKRQ